MRVGKTKTGKKVVAISRDDWTAIAEANEWHDSSTAIRFAQAHPDESFEVRVEPYSDRFFAVYLNSELVCVTVYRKGAMAVRDLLEQLWGRVQESRNVEFGTR